MGLQKAKTVLIYHYRQNIREGFFINLQQKVEATKYKCLEMCIHAGTGHVTSAFSCAEIMVVLYYKIMRYDIHQPHWPDRDRFIMSKNHGSVITYPILADLGYLAKEELDFFLSNGSRLGSHSKNSINGIDFSGGSLGIGLGVAAGLAYGAKLDNKDWLTFALVGDGECYEGSIWEAAMFAGHYQLNNLVVIIDRNKMCVTDFTETILREEPFALKWTAFNWEVREVDGHDIEQLLTVLSDIRNRNSQKPLCIIANTIKGNGIDFMSNKRFMHGVAPSGDYAKKALSQLKEGASYGQ